MSQPLTKFGVLTPGQGSSRPPQRPPTPPEAVATPAGTPVVLPGAARPPAPDNKPKTPGWTCAKCTYVHRGREASFLACAVCQMKKHGSLPNNAPEQQPGRPVDRPAASDQVYIMPLFCARVQWSDTSSRWSTTCESMLGGQRWGLCR